MKINVNKAMLMSAGLGTRLRPFTAFKTKALLPLFGIPIAQFAMDSIVSAGVTSIVANIHHDPENTRTGLLKLARGGAELHISDESHQLLGSAGGIQKALEWLRPGPFFLANSDVLSDVDWRALSERHQRLRQRFDIDLTLAILPVGPPGGFYREILVDSMAERVTGLGELESGRPFFMGAAVLELSALKNVPPAGPAEFVPTILEPAIRHGKVGVYLQDAIWYDIGSPKLWKDTHFSLMDRLESGTFPSRASKAWQDRIETENVRIGDHLWIARHAKRPWGISSWLAPGYWNPLDSAPLHSRGFSLGPNAILYGYGSEGSDHNLSNGIGYQGAWLSC